MHSTEIRSQLQQLQARITPLRDIEPLRKLHADAQQDDAISGILAPQCSTRCADAGTALRDAQTHNSEMQPLLSRQRELAMLLDVTVKQEEEAHRAGLRKVSDGLALELQTLERQYIRTYKEYITSRRNQVPALGGEPRAFFFSSMQPEGWTNTTTSRLVIDGVF
jgi:hypothetical protein